MQYLNLCMCYFGVKPAHIQTLISDALQMLLCRLHGADVCSCVTLLCHVSVRARVTAATVYARCVA